MASVTLFAENACDEANAPRSSLHQGLVNVKVPTDDFFDGRNLNQVSDLQEAVENFVFKLEQGDFLTWEAVVCEEQGLRLTAHQKKAMESLLSFSEDEDDQILYLNETARPSERWYVILRTSDKTRLLYISLTSGSRTRGGNK